MTDTAIRVEKVSKRYRIGLRESLHDTIADTLTSWIGSPLSNLRKLRSLTRFSEHRYEADVLWALKDVSFQVKEGEVVGIIGKNGVGKSTLLKIISRITEPTSGRVEIRGRVASLLEVGTGFHPELTGRENIYLNGAILGMRRGEIRSKFDEIVTFAEVESFVDTPVKRYSTGMRVRLAFSVAAHLEPEVLLVDEVLAVGDVGFQKKCLGKISEVGRNGRTVLLVSHNMAAIMSLGNRGIWLNDGQIAFIGGVQEVVDRYLHHVSGEDEQVAVGNIIRKVELCRNGSTYATRAVQTGDSLRIFLALQLREPLASPRIALLFFSELGLRIFTVSSHVASNQRYFDSGQTNVECRIPKLPLLPGRYYINIRVEGHGKTVERIDRAAWLEVMEGDFYRTGYRVRKAHGIVAVENEWYYPDSVENVSCGTNASGARTT